MAGHESNSDSRHIASRPSLARKADDADPDDVLENYRNYLLLLARIHTDRKLRSKISDSDLVQETLIQANRDFNRFRGQTESELTHWLRAIMSTKQARLARHYYGSAARDPRLEVQLQDRFDDSSQMLDRAFVECGSSPSQHLAKREGAVLLAEALAALPDHYREVVVLRHIEGHKMREVARRMGRTVDSVNKLWARAMIQLRSSMKGPD